jgi:tetratricopeptide (TPR) repeat protein
MRGLALLVAVALPGLPSAARADKNADAIRLLDEGFELFKKGDLESLGMARARFDQAREMFPEKANPYRLLGMTDARLGRCDDAVRELEQFMKLAKPDDQRIVEAATIRDQCREKLAERIAPATVAATQAPPAAAPNQAVVAPAPSEGLLSGPKRNYLIIGGAAAAAVVVIAVVIAVAVAAASHTPTPFETAIRLPAVMGP